MKTMMLAMLLVASTTFACAGATSEETGSTQQGQVQQDIDKPAPNPNPNPGPSCRPLPNPFGGPGLTGANPASVYCSAMGFGLELETSQCSFNDGTKCEQWAFWRGECGQSHSFCAQQGGTLSADGTCTLAGKTCDQHDFAQTCVCE